MKILMTTDLFPPNLGGGVENVVYEISKRLVLKGHTVHVLTSKQTNTQKSELLNGIFVTRVKYFDLTKYLGLQTNLSIEYIPALENLIKSIKPDIVNAHNLFFFSTLIAARQKKISKYPLVTTLHLSDLSRIGGFSGYLAKKYEERMGGYIISNSDRLIAVSDSVRKHAIDLGASDNKIDVIPNTVDKNLFNPRPRNDKNIRIVFVGRLIKNKGPHIFLEAAEHILEKSHNVTFTMIGEGPMRDELTERITRRHLNGKIKVIGIVPNIHSVLPDFDIMIRSSLTEGMPLTVLEGMSSGLAVVTSKVGGVSEIIKDDVNGLLTSPGSVDEIVSCISKLVTDPELRNNIKLNARKFIENYHTWDDISDLTLRSYNKVLE